MLGGLRGQVNETRGVGRSCRRSQKLLGEKVRRGRRWTSAGVSLARFGGISLLKFPKKSFSTAWGPAGGRGKAERNLCSAKPFLHPETGGPWKPVYINYP